MLAAFLIGIILLVFGTVSENMKAAELNDRYLRQARETEIALINGAVHAARRVNSYGSPGHYTQFALEMAYRPYFLSIGYCRQAMDVLMRITGVTAEQFLVWIVNYHTPNIDRNVPPPPYTLYVLRGQYYIRLYTPRQLFGEGKYLFNKKKILVPVSLVESELTAYKNCLCGGEILNIEDEPYWQNAYHVVSCGESVDTFMARYPGDVLFQRYFGRPDWRNYA